MAGGQTLTCGVTEILNWVCEENEESLRTEPHKASHPELPLDSILPSPLSAERGGALTGQLSYADRERLLQDLDRLSEGDNVSSEQLLKEIADWAKSLNPKFGFEHSLLRNVAQLSCHLRDHNDESDIVAIARGALRFVLDNEHDSAASPEWTLLCHAFIASYAVHEVAIRLGVPLTYNPPSITNEEKERAEEMFLQLAEKSATDDDELIRQAMENLLELKTLFQCNFLRRLDNNANVLISVLNDPHQDDDHRSFARGALRYLVEDDDVISDHLGLIGYLDDHFVLQMAVDLINPHREPLIELLDEVVGMWPFLNSLVIDDGTGHQPASEFAILNSALTCPNLRSQDSLTTFLIAPETGPTPILMGFLATLGLIQESGQRELTENSFQDGQKVIVDFSAVAEFAGFDMLGTRRMFKLRQFYTERGQQMERIRYWPLADLRRLIPADSDRVIRGKIKHDLGKSELLLPGLEYLFNASQSADVTGIERRIIVVTSTTLAHEFCNSVELFGHALKDVVPMGHLASDGETVEPWSKRFGSKEPILVFASDLDLAARFAEDDPSRNHPIIVDLSGRNAGKNASLKRLARFKIPTVLVASERIANEVVTGTDENAEIWEWSADDFSALLWPEQNNGQHTGELSRFEQKLKSNAGVEPQIISVSMPLTAATHESFLKLRRLAKQRGDEQIASLDDLVTLGYRVATHLIRCATQMREKLPSSETLSTQLDQMGDIVQRSRFLSVEEQTAAKDLIENLNHLLELLRQHNPKAEAIERLLVRFPNAAVVCPDARLLPDLESSYRQLVNRVLSNCSPADSFENGLIIPGWFRKCRMASLLSPPVGDPTFIVLYDVEQNWYSGFSSERRTAKTQRRACSSRARIFPRLKNWREPKPVVPSTGSMPTTDLNEFEEVRSEVFDRYKSRIQQSATTSDHELNVPARLVMFIGGSYGFFSETYRLNVVTHLLENAAAETDEKATVIPTPANKLQPGDVIVFRLRSRDVIREVADTLLAPGTREMSSLWREALLRYVEDQSLTVSELCERLQDAGCKLGQQAIQNWLNVDEIIGPQAFKRDVPAIAKLTGDRRLVENVDKVIAAIKEVRSAHQQKAPRILAKKVRESAVEVLKREQADSSLIRLHDDFVLVRVAEVEPDLITVRYSSTNQLIEGESWLE